MKLAPKSHAVTTQRPVTTHGVPDWWMKRADALHAMCEWIARQRTSSRPRGRIMAAAVRLWRGRSLGGGHSLRMSLARAAAIYCKWQKHGRAALLYRYAGPRASRLDTRPTTQWRTRQRGWERNCRKRFLAVLLDPGIQSIGDAKARVLRPHRGRVSESALDGLLNGVDRRALTRLYAIRQELAVWERQSRLSIARLSKLAGITEERLKTRLSRIATAALSKP